MTKREILKKLIIKGTENLIRSHYPDFGENKEMDTSTANIISNARKLFGNIQPLLEILTEISGRKFPTINDEDIPIPQFAMIVPISSLSGHNYPLNEPVLSIPNTGTCYMVTGICGNLMTRKQYALRPATLKQINDFMVTVPESVITTLSKNFHIERA